MPEQRYTPFEIAEVAHEANRVLQQIHNAHHPDTGVPVAAPWAEFPADQAQGVAEGVVNALRGDTPAELHEGWCEHKREAGWIYGPVKDADAKTHPCLVDYDDLPAYQQEKDDLFSAIVDALGDVEDPDVDLAGRHPGVQDVARYLLDVNPNLPPHLSLVARMCRVLAVSMLRGIDDCPQLTRGLDDLLRAKDAFVRAAL